MPDRPILPTEVRVAPAGSAFAHACRLIRALELIRAPADADAHAQQRASFAEQALGKLTPEQVEALVRTGEGRPRGAALVYEPFDLPAGYALVSFPGDPGFTCGIAPNGDVSS